MFVRIILMRIIPRRMVYGRRKTGKTFLVENFIKHDKFFFVNRDSTALDKKSGEIYTYNFNFVIG